MVWFVRVSCPFLKVEYESEFKARPFCKKDGEYLDSRKRNTGCRGCDMLELTPTERAYRYRQMFARR